MLPKSRVIPALFVGVGIALTAGGIAAPAVMTADARLPLDVGNLTWTLVDEDATYKPLTDPHAEVAHRPVTRQLHLQIQNPSDEDTATVRVGSTWLEDQQASANRGLISAQTWSYEMDRRTGEATGPATLAYTIGMPTTQVDVPGYWLKFPMNAKQETYDVFDETLRDAYPAVYMDATKIDGRTVYHYRQEIPPTNVAQQYADMFNTRMFEIPEKEGEPQPEDGADNTESDAGEASEPEGGDPAPGEAAPEPPAEEAPEEAPPVVNQQLEEGDEAAEKTEEDSDSEESKPKVKTEQGYLHYAATKDLYVDQVTGLVVDAQVAVDKYYALASGERVDDVLTFHGDVREEDTHAIISQIADVSDGKQAEWIRFLVIAVGVIVALGALAVALRPSRRRG